MRGDNTQRKDPGEKRNTKLGDQILDEHAFIQKTREKAHNYDKYSGCSQSVLLSLQEAFDIGSQESFKAATVLSGGIARRGETCGALIGGLMALGLVIGREDITNTETYRQAMNPALEMCDRFRQAIKAAFAFHDDLHSTMCREIQEKTFGRSYDLNDPTDYQAFLDIGGHENQGCPKVCGIAAEVGATMILKCLHNPR